MAKSPSVYSSQEFWTAYASLLYCPPAKLGEETVGQQEPTLRQRLFQWFDEGRKRGCLEREIRVLCLGMGVGTFDFPVLRLIDECRRAVAPKRQLKVLGIDSQAAPLACARQIFPRLSVAQFPSSGKEFSIAVGTTVWPTAPETLQPSTHGVMTVPKLSDTDWTPWMDPWVDRTSDGQSMLSCCVYDLDCLQPESSMENASDRLSADCMSDGQMNILRTMPSDWAKHVRNHVPGGFDLVISAFCLHHLYWRRVVAIEAASLLTDTGLFLLGTMDRSDAQAFQGIQRGDSSRAVNRASEIFLAKLGSQRTSYERRQRSLAGAHQQSEIIDLLNHAGMKRETFAPVRYSNLITPKTGLVDLIKTRGLTPFRHLETLLHSEVYEACQKTVEDIIGGLGEEEFQCNAVWHAFNFPQDDRSAFVQNRVTRKFALQDDAPSHFGRHGDCNLQHFARNEYELLETQVIANEVPAGIDDPDWVKALVGVSVATGLWHSSMDVGCFGLSAKTARGMKGFQLFYNPLARNKTQVNDDLTGSDGLYANLAGLSAYLLSRRVEFPSREYSNSGVLLGFLPLFPLPPVFHYKFNRDANGSVGHTNPGFRSPVTLKWHRSFIEVILEIRLADVEPGSDHVTKHLQSLHDAFWRESQSERAIQHEMGTNCILRLDQERFAKSGPTLVALDRFIKQTVRNGLRNRLTWLDVGKFATHFHEACAESLGKSLANSISKVLETRHNDSPECETTAGMMLETMLLLSMLYSGKSMIVYPAAFKDPKSGAYIADDSIILCYREHLSEDDIRHEYRKLDAIYRLMGLKKLEKIGQDSATTNFAHELKRVGENLGNLAPEPVARVSERPLVHVAKAINIDQYNSLMQAHAGATEGNSPVLSVDSLYGTLLLRPDVPDIVRDNVGLCFYPQGINDVASLMGLWCQAKSAVDLRRLLRLQQGAPLGTLGWLLENIWACSVRLLPLASSPVFDFAKDDPKAQEGQGTLLLVAEVERLAHICKQANRVGLSFSVTGSRSVMDFPLAGVDAKDIGWLGRALLAILRDYAMYTRPPCDVVVHVEQQGAGSSTKFALSFGHKVVTTTCNKTFMEQFICIQQGAINADLYRGDGTHTKEVVDLCIQELGGVVLYRCLDRDPRDSEGKRRLARWGVTLRLKGNEPQ